jgi:hypothetical protein
MSFALLTEQEKPSSSEHPFDAHVVLLNSYIPPHALPVYVELSRRVRKFTVLLSTPMESHRHWKPDWGTLDVRLQRTLTIERPWKHRAGFRDKLNVHIPWNTLGLLRKLRPDVVLSAELGPRSLFSALYTMFTGTPLVLVATLSEHQELGRGWARYWLRRWLIRRARCIAVNGHSGARYLRRLGADPNRLFHVPYSAVPNYFDHLPLVRPSSQSHKLFYVGQLVERKGLVPFVEALARWAVKHPERTVEFEIAGSGPLEPVLRSLRLPENIQLRLLGERTFDELTGCYAKAGILVFPTLSDEWGLVVNEALAAGLPVLGSTYSQAVEELCIEGETGWRFRTTVAGEMDDAIDRALSTSADTLDTMRRAGHELVKKLTPAYAAEGFLTTIKAALGGTECMKPDHAAMGNV